MKTYKFKSSLSREIEIVDLADQYRKARAVITQPHRAEFYHIIWFQEGTSTHLVDFTQVHIAPNTLLFLDKDVVHAFSNTVAATGVVILFTEPFFYQSDLDFKYLKNNALFRDSAALVQLDADAPTQVLTTLMEMIQDEYRKPQDQFQKQILQNYLHNFLMLNERIHLTNEAGTFNTGIDWDYLIAFKRLLNEHFSVEKQVAFYAKKLNISEKRLSLASKKIIGKTPKELIIERVLLESKRLLVNTNITIKEIAFELGFDEPGNFNKYFKKYTAKTPLEFRDSILSSGNSLNK